jgi:hypothetical protein
MIDLLFDYKRKDVFLSGANEGPYMRENCERLVFLMGWGEKGGNRAV